MLRVLGKALGVKKGAIVVDACVADMYEAASEKGSSFGESHIGWLHEWIGSLVVAKEVGSNGLSILPNCVDSNVCS